jgi:hypothetical protein
MPLSHNRYSPDAELTHPLLNEYSNTDLLNRKFRRWTWLLSMVFLVVLSLLTLQLLGVLPLSPFQPALKITGR